MAPLSSRPQSPKTPTQKLHRLDVDLACRASTSRLRRRQRSPARRLASVVTRQAFLPLHFDEPAVGCCIWSSCQLLYHHAYQLKWCLKISEYALFKYWVFFIESSGRNRQKETPDTVSDDWSKAWTKAQTKADLLVAGNSWPLSHYSSWWRIWPYYMRRLNVVIGFCFWFLWSVINIHHFARAGKQRWEQQRGWSLGDGSFVFDWWPLHPETGHVFELRQLRPWWGGPSHRVRPVWTVLPSVLRQHQGQWYSSLISLLQLLSVGFW